MSSPLVIGVSGHRDPLPAALPQLTRHVDELLADLRQRLPDTELRIMTGMAQGADLLAAQVAINAHCKVDALLPLPLERYIEDFDVESAAALRALLAHSAVTCKLLPAPPGADHDAKHGAGRNVFYANLTQALIDRCNLLVALWDGKFPARAGGTADTVLRHLGVRTHHGSDGSRIEFRDADAAAGATASSHFVYWIPTPRRDGAAVRNAPRYLTGISENLLAVHGAGMPQPLAQQLVDLNARNRECAQARRKHARERPDC